MAKKNILLCLLGMTPAVLTETLFALTQKEGLVPDEIHALTTRKGKDEFQQQALDEFYQDYGLKPIPLQMHVFECDQQVLDDVRSPRDYECMADLMNQIIRELTQQDDVQLHVSIAGGRKTMSFYLGYILSLYARPQDRLSHVLVSSPEFEVKGFNYPKPDQDPDIVELSDIPFIRLRHELPDYLLQENLSFSETIERAEKALQSPYLEINLKDKNIVYSKERIPLHLEPKQLARYAMLIWRFRDGLSTSSKEIINMTQDYLTLLELLNEDKDHHYDQLLEDLNKLQKINDFLDQPAQLENREERSLKWKEQQKIIDSLNRRVLGKNLTEIRNELKKQLGSEQSPYFIPRPKKGANYRPYQLLTHQIHLIGFPSEHFDHPQG